MKKKLLLLVCILAIVMSACDNGEFRELTEVVDGFMIDAAAGRVDEAKTWLSEYSNVEPEDYVNCTVSGIAAREISLLGSEEYCCGAVYLVADSSKGQLLFELKGDDLDGRAVNWKISSITRLDNATEDMAAFLSTFPNQLFYGETYKLIKNFFNGPDRDQYVAGEITEQEIKAITANKRISSVVNYLDGSTVHIFANTISPLGRVHFVIAEAVFEGDKWKIISLLSTQNPGFGAALESRGYNTAVREGINYYLNMYYAGHLLDMKGSVLGRAYYVAVAGNFCLFNKDFEGGLFFAFCNDEQKEFLQQVEPGTPVIVDYAKYEYFGFTRYVLDSVEEMK